MNDILHLIYIPMTGVGLYGGYRGDDWYQDRIEIFKKYTAQSLLNQTRKDFVLWLSFRSEEENSLHTFELLHWLKSNKFNFITTFDGLMYFDDKFEKKFKSRLMNSGRVIRSAIRNKILLSYIPSLKEIWEDKNETLQFRLKKSLNTVSKSLNRVNFNWVYMTRIDSDDMFHDEAIRQIREIKPFEGAIVMRNGYIYNADTKKLAYYLPRTNPPFHTIIFRAEVFFDFKKHFDYYHDFKSHEDIPRVFRTVCLQDYLYCVFTHNPKMHISTIWNHPFRGPMIKDNVRILKHFGVNQNPL